MAENIRLISGNHIIAEAALAAGCSFFGGYPITPSSEVAEFLSRRLPQSGGYFIQMEDEIASIAACIGASLVGHKAMTATSGPGYSLMQENIGFAAMGEVPVVIINVMRGGPSTGLPTKTSQGDLYQARYGTHGDAPAIAIVPSTVTEAFHAVIKAFNFSEIFRTPVSVLADEVLGHMIESVKMPEPGSYDVVNRRKPEDYSTYSHYDHKTSDVGKPLANYGEGARFHVTGLTHDETGFPTNEPSQIALCHNRLLDKVHDNRDKLFWREADGIEGAEIAFVSVGTAARSARVVMNELRKKGKKVGLYRPVIFWPFPSEDLEKSIADAKIVVVPEMNAGQLVEEVRKYAPRGARIIQVNRFDGELLAPQQISDAISEVVEDI
ncbi:MAG: 2-oxoacid:acceptor oxidoreductase subunit alpha [Planctomycetota bacterium]